MLSTTQVATGSVLGSGVEQARRRGALGAQPAGGGRVAGDAPDWPRLVGTLHLRAGALIIGYPRCVLGFALLWLTATAIWLRSRRAPVDHQRQRHLEEGNLTAGLEAGAQPLADQRPPVPAPPAPPNHRAPQFGVTTKERAP